MENIENTSSIEELKPKRGFNPSKYKLVTFSRIDENNSFLNLEKNGKWIGYVKYNSETAKANIQIKDITELKNLQKIALALENGEITIE